MCSIRIKYSPEGRDLGIVKVKVLDAVLEEPYQHTHPHWSLSRIERGLTGIESNGSGGKRCHALLPHLEPYGTGAVERSSSAGSLGHVDVEWTGVEDRNIGLESNGRPSSDGDGRGFGSICLRANVTSQVSRGDIRDRRVGVSVCPDANIFTTDSASVDELVKAVYIKVSMFYFFTGLQEKAYSGQMSGRRTPR